ncbi:MAG: FtsK/SpoIIIE domain-containing protein, partial [Actinomycetes bacterium]
SGALSGPVDPWPPLADLDNITTDYFTGVPVGVTIRGEVVRGRLSEANYVVGGTMGSGKSTLVITLILGAMLDPLVEIDVVVMAENADYEPMAPRLRSLVTGAGEDTATTCLAMLTSLYEELSIRGQALREHDARATTRPLAERDPRLRPRVMVIDECQNLFIGEHSKDAIEVASKLMSTARKYAITLMFLTPEPSKDALPRKIITIASNKACFAIGDQLGNDAVLGTGSYKAGISAVGLTPKTDEGPGDVGTCMARGFTPKPGLLRSFYLPQDDAHRITQRALQLRGEHLIPTPVTRTLLGDVHDALGGREKVRSAEVLAELKSRWPATYGKWSAQRFSAALEAQGVVRKKRSIDGDPGQQVILLTEVATAIEDDDESDPDQDGAR